MTDIECVFRAVGGDGLLVIKDHGVVLGLLSVILPLLGRQLVLEVVGRQPELKHVHGILLLHVLDNRIDTVPVITHHIN